MNPQSIVPIVPQIVLVQRGNSVWGINAVRLILVATELAIQHRAKIAETVGVIVGVLRANNAKTTLVWL